MRGDGKCWQGGEQCQERLVTEGLKEIINISEGQLRLLSSFTDKAREARLRWFGHVHWRDS